MIENATIWKFPLFVTDRQVVLRPKGSYFLSVQMQGTQPVMWLAVPDPNAEKVEMVIHWFGTGHKLGPAIGWKYLGTIQEVSLGLVWHLFEE